MTRKEALAELIAKVDAGDATAVDIYEVMGRGGLHAIGAYNGSLDAAKALHEAVLDGWGWDVSCMQVTSVWGLQRNGPVIQGTALDPARAWLLAILRALHAMEAAE